MRILSKAAVLTAVVLLAGACCPCRSYQKKTRRPLTGTQWQLVQLNGRSIQSEAGRFTITLRADDGQINGMGACNRIFGNYAEGEKRALKIGPLASTKMICPGADLERQFTAALEATTHYDMDGPMLLLLSNGELKAIFQALPASNAEAGQK